MDYNYKYPSAPWPWLIAVLRQKRQIGCRLSLAAAAAGRRRPIRGTAPTILWQTRLKFGRHGLDPGRRGSVSGRRRSHFGGHCSHFGRRRSHFGRRRSSFSRQG